MSDQCMRCQDLERALDILRTALEDLADGDCFYGDGCPTFGSRHGQCDSCKAREALADATTARLSADPAADIELYDEEGLP